MKRYSDFEEFHTRLIKQVLRAPYLPAKSLFKLSNSELEKRKLDLEKYIKSICLRKDIAQLADFLSFLEVKYQKQKWKFGVGEGLGFYLWLKGRKQIEKQRR